MLIPFYIAGFIFGGLLLFAIANRIPNRSAKISLRAIAILAGPLFFLIFSIFSGLKREKTYEMEWLTGQPATHYLFDRKLSIQEQQNVVVLRRYTNDNRQCYNVLISRELSDYLEGLHKHTVQVQYTVTYDFFQFRTYSIQHIGDFPYHPNGSSFKTAGDNLGDSCFR